eukprot:TRINITY_DN27714_c0_g1_i1.p1 TRINITY_DN27714_c0_g1~~TRINITY_DN27714_c0_g1_i1.p1  ORF type:complete len:607 (+),score=67.33 TRINITY_DN27714_c0_g1_i1:13-1833(+)
MRNNCSQPTIEHCTLVDNTAMPNQKSLVTDLQIVGQSAVLQFVLEKKMIQICLNKFEIGLCQKGLTLGCGISYRNFIKSRVLSAFNTKCISYSAVPSSRINDDLDEGGQQYIFNESEVESDAKEEKLMKNFKKRSPEIRYFDTAQIFVKGGDGGDGVIAFRREKFVPKGGPAGGNGGDGGNVWAEAQTGMSSLSSFRHKVHYKAEDGGRGQGKDCTGKCGEDVVISVPLGTVIRYSNAEEGTPPIAELVHDGDRALIMAGGKGGRGNSSFKTNKNSAPLLSEKGSKGQESWVELELKIVADAGIIGVPNAGKSTLLSVISAAKPKIANYPFTTLIPNLGVCETDFISTVFADIPGLLEGAHSGIGLGHDFLRHIQRCRVLVHILDGTSPDPIYDYQAIQLELQLFNPELINKPQVIAYNKMDVPESAEFFELVREYLIIEKKVDEKNIFAISAVTGEGVVNVVRRVRQQLQTLSDEPVRLHREALNVREVPKTTSFEDYQIEVDAATRTFYVRGDGIERLAEMTNWDYFQAVCRFQRVLYLTRINSKLEKSGIQEGDTVVIGSHQFQWSSNKSQRALFETWMEDVEDRGVVSMGSSKWPRPKKLED